VPWSVAPPVQTVLYANPVCRNGTEIEVPLTLVNSGTGPINALDLTKISVQILAGTGQATVLNSHLSIPLGGSFLSGASITISVHLQVPATVRKLKLNEEGFVKGSYNKPYRFSSAQVIFP
jgi:hypothetical protein